VQCVTVESFGRRRKSWTPSRRLTGNNTTCRQGRVGSGTVAGQHVAVVHQTAVINHALDVVYDRLNVAVVIAYLCLQDGPTKMIPSYLIVFACNS